MTASESNGVTVDDSGGQRPASVTEAEPAPGPEARPAALAPSEEAAAAPAAAEPALAVAATPAAATSAAEAPAAATPAAEAPAAETPAAEVQPTTNAEPASIPAAATEAALATTPDVPAEARAVAAQAPAAAAMTVAEELPRADKDAAAAPSGVTAGPAGEAPAGEAPAGEKAQAGAEGATQDDAAQAGAEDAAPKKKRRRRKKKSAEEGGRRPRRRRARKEIITQKPVAGSWFEAKPEIDDAMRAEISEHLAQRFRLNKQSASNVLALLDADYTISFIAKYRSERVGGLDEPRLRKVRDRIAELAALIIRRNEILARLEAECPDSGLAGLVSKTVDPRVLEDAQYAIRSRRRSKGSKAYKAREQGLEPLAQKILEQGETEGEIEEIAGAFLSEAVSDVQAVLDGARAIVIDKLSLDPDLRRELRHQVYTRGILVAGPRPGKEEAETKYKSFYTYREAVRRVPPHRLLAVERGVRERVLEVKIEAPPSVLPAVEGKVLKKGGSIWTELLRDCIQEMIERFLPTVSKEVRRNLRDEAENRSIETFCSNLGHLLLQPPTRDKVVAGVDPGTKNSIRLAVVDPKGEFIGSRTLYPYEPKGDRAGATRAFLNFLEDYRVDIVAIGNGSASRTADRFLAGVIKQASGELKARRAVVNESGAVVYAASELGKSEFPELDVATRAAISIARRLQDPLSELVKVEPRFLGVGQYQHDVNQKTLGQALYEEVVSVVHSVGVEINRASKALLEHLSGVDDTLLENLMQYRKEKGPLQKRTDLFEVEKLGPKAYEQLAGFVRIPDGPDPLDNTDIHPECYRIVEQMCVSIGRTVANVLTDPSEVARIEKTRFVSERFGLHTIDAMMATMRSPRSDPRDAVEPIVYREDVVELEDLEVDMVLEGTVTNVTDFGAFVDIGVHQDGLIHISEMADSFVKHPSEVIRVGDRVKSKVISVDKKNRRIGLSVRALGGDASGGQRGDRASASDSGHMRAGAPSGGQGRGGPGRGGPGRGGPGRGNQSRAGTGSSPRTPGARGGPGGRSATGGRSGPGRSSPGGGKGRPRSGGGRGSSSDRGSHGPRQAPNPASRGFRIGDVLSFEDKKKSEES